MDNEINLFMQKHFPTIERDNAKNTVPDDNLDLNKPLILCPEMLPMPRSLNIAPARKDILLAQMCSDCGVAQLPKALRSDHLNQNIFQNSPPAKEQQKPSILARHLIFLNDL